MANTEAMTVSIRRGSQARIKALIMKGLYRNRSEFADKAIQLKLEYDETQIREK